MLNAERYLTELFGTLANATEEAKITSGELPVGSVAEILQTFN